VQLHIEVEYDKKAELQMNLTEASHDKASIRYDN